ncbi:MAG: GNAT family N-acetyltransferase [Alphaproteobacteria bacterium]|nr:GNAT family N-acetyltransferase [Alphaproteobacteria bacterium]
MAATNGSTVPSLPNTHLKPLAAAALVLETERLRLRPLNGDDLDLGRAIFLDPEVVKYVCPPSTPENLPTELQTASARGAGGRLGVWCVLDKHSGEKLGTGVLLPLPIEGDDTDWSLVVEDQYPDAEIEIGYMFKRTAWGQGYATEACSRLLRFAFEQTALEDVVAVTDLENHASKHVLRKAGLRDRGERHAYSELIPGFGITREEWTSDQSASC